MQMFVIRHLRGNVNTCFVSLRHHPSLSAAALFCYDDGTSGLMSSKLIPVHVKWRVYSFTSSQVDSLIAWGGIAVR